MGHKVRWGILAPGGIANRFADALKVVPGAELVAVGSRSKERAEEFAKKHGATRAHGSYEALAADPDVDVVYVASPHTFHKEHGLLCLRGGKGVVCEKPFTVNAAELEELVSVARTSGLFLMEAMWTRFLPMVRRIREWVRSGEIGEVRMMTADFGFRSEADEQHRLFNPALGGGALLDIGVYVVSFAAMVMDAEPGRVESMVHPAGTGVDAQEVMLLEYPGARHAMLSASLEANTTHEAYIYGTRGSIHAPRPFYKGQRAALTIHGRKPEEFEEALRLNGFEYQIEEAMRSLAAGETESPILPLEESLRVMRTLDRIRAPWGWKYPTE
jgi:dihydrodiol dehydrogenase / D-xylose 1-dehydrogenase (NADP)